ncbi:hypothetical protein [Neolewinella sp.]|uniref:hypothetical protein n=1 Tax=Neolewinella sp. TaxID=2993543 RepID=UPI003B51D459
MPIRYLIALILLLPAISYACSCTNDHIPLEEAICRADTTGTMVLAVTLQRHLDGNAAELQIDEVLVGQTDKRTLTVGAETSCAWYIDLEPVGQRYLYFYWPQSYGDYEGDLFGCAYNANIYRLNRQGTEVEYSYTASGSTQNVGLRDRSFRNLIANRACGNELPDTRPTNPLRKIEVAGSIGTGGSISLSVPEGDMPALQTLRCYRTDGRLLAEIDLRDYVAGKAIDLSRLPRGYNLLYITDGVWRKTLPLIVSE